MQRLLLPLLLVFATVSTAAAGDAEKQQLHIYLMIGQSNMAGRATVPDNAKAPVDRGFLLNAEDKWEPATNPLNRYSTIRKGLNMQRLSPAYAFATTMLEADKTASIGLVVNAKGGSSISQWKKGTRFYNDAIRRVKAAEKTGVLKGIVWHQGESDAANPKYLEELKQLIADFRKDLGNAKLPFVAGQVKDVKPINDFVARLPQEVPHTGFASAEGLKTTDRWHFDTQGQLTLGRRYAAAMLKLTGGK